VVSGRKCKDTSIYRPSHTQTYTNNSFSRPHERLWQVKFHEVLGIRNDIALLSIANAALEIREAIKRVDEDYVKRRMAISLEDSTKIRTANAYPHAADGATTGVDFSSWVDWLELGFDPEGKLMFERPPTSDGKIRFDIPGVKTDFPDFIRSGYPQSEGTCILLPRRTCGPSGQDATWEVSLCLRDREMAHLRFVTELGGWAKKILDRDLKDIRRQNGGAQEFRRAQAKAMSNGWDDTGYDVPNVDDLDDGDSLDPKRQKLSGTPSESAEAMDLTSD
jgi:hypothetical protein